MMEKPVDKHYMIRATEFVDTLFDNGYFDKEVKREDLRRVNELLGFLFQSNVESAVKCDRAIRKIREQEKE